ncbi:MAG: hypothetical protein AAGB34_09910 [Planctomycetota bacterium]
MDTNPIQSAPPPPTYRIDLYRLSGAVAPLATHVAGGLAGDQRAGDTVSLSMQEPMLRSRVSMLRDLTNSTRGWGYDHDLERLAASLNRVGRSISSVTGEGADQAAQSELWRLLAQLGQDATRIPPKETVLSIAGSVEQDPAELAQQARQSMLESEVAPETAAGFGQ